MPLDLSQLKSAVVIEDASEIEKRLLEAYEKSPVATCQHTTLRKSDGDTPIQIEKSLSLKARDGAPKMPKSAELEAMARGVGIRWQEAHAERVVPYWASDERVDSHGDIVKQTWHFDEFRQNPVIPYGHNSWKPPIGNAIQWQVLDRRAKDYKGPALYLLALFATEDESYEADSVFRLVKSGFLKAGSVGFYSKKIINIEDEEERRKLGLGRWGYILDENHLIEFSVTTIGANAGALTVLSGAKAKGLVVPGDVRTIREFERQRIERSTRSRDEWEETDSRWVQIARTVFPDETFERHAELDEPIGEAGTDLPNYRASDSSVQEQLDRIANAFDDMAFSLGKRLDDLRDEIAEMRTEGFAGKGSQDSEEGEANGLVSLLGERSSSILDKLDRHRTTGNRSGE